MVSSYMLEMPSCVGVSVFNLFKRKCKMPKKQIEVENTVALSATDLDTLNSITDRKSTRLNSSH